MSENDIRPAGLLAEKVRQEDEGRAVRSAAKRREIARRFRLQLRGHIRDAETGHPTLEQLHTLHRRRVEQLHDEMHAGATVHHRVSVVVRALPALVTAIDAVLLYSYCADIFNARFAELSPAGLAAASLAALGSGVTYACLTTTGTRLRDYRDGLGEIRWRSTGWATRLLAGLSVVIVLTLAVLMFYRVTTKARDAGAAYVDPSQVDMLGWVFAILSACANIIVVAAHALDGSALAADARNSGRAVRRAGRRLDRARRRAWAQAQRADPDADPLDDLDLTTGRPTP